jgi:hypothetical protein
MNITNKFANSVAAVRWIVNREYKKHWFLGLRQCELEIESLEGSLTRWTWKRALLTILGRYRPEEELLLQKKVLEEEKQRIIDEHPEVLELSYEELQNLYAKPCFRAVQAHYIAKLHVAAQYPVLGEGGAEMLLGLDSEERDEVLSLAMGRVGQTCSDIALRDAANVLAELPEEQRKQALILAGQQVVNNQAIQNLSGTNVTLMGDTSSNGSI